MQYQLLSRKEVASLPGAASLLLDVSLPFERLERGEGFFVPFEDSGFPDNKTLTSAIKRHPKARAGGFLFLEAGEPVQGCYVVRLSALQSQHSALEARIAGLCAPIGGATLGTLKRRLKPIGEAEIKKALEEMLSRRELTETCEFHKYNKRAIYTYEVTNG